jgi:DNA-binding winged helix-turn-helix (wHTH) protein/TolB-like protein/Tfp pilus assembly protein PilF
MTKVSLHEFGPYRLYSSKHLLLRYGTPVPLTPKAFDVLALLVHNGGDVLGKGDLLRRVWPDSYADAANLTVHIEELNRALGRTTDGREYIETIPRKGYLFQVPVKHLEEDAPDEPIRGALLPHDGDSTRRVRELPAHRRIRLLIAAAVAGLLLMGGWLYLRRRRKPPAEVSAGVPSIAVLPFHSLSASPDQEYLGLGLPDALITRLGAVHQMVVRPTGSVTRYLKGEEDPVSAGRQLRVGTVLDGTIQRSGDSIRVVVRLLKVADGSQLWSDTFDERFTNMFAVEDSISQEVAKALELQLSGEEQQQLAKRYTENSAAYQFYLKGRYFWGKRTPASVNESIGYFENAINQDPHYALAYAGLAESYILLGSSGYSQLPPREAMPKARAAAERALAIDSTLAEAHTSLAYVRLIYDWDWQGSKQEFDRALQLNPADTTALHWYSHYLSAMGLHDESIQASKRALEIDPVDLSLNEHLAWTYLMARQYDRAIEQCRKTIDLDPSFALAHRRLGEAYLYQRGYPEAVTEFQKGLQLSGGAVVYQALLGEAEALAGQREAASPTLSDLEKLARRRYVSSFAIATVCLGLGDKDQTFRWLDKAFGERADSLAYAKVDPQYDSLRSDPRWTALLQRLKLN